MGNEASSSSSSSAHQGSDIPHDIVSRTELKQLYNSPVDSVQVVRRPLDAPGGLGDALMLATDIGHEGVIAEAGGKSWLVHKVPSGVGSGGHTVVVDSQHMSREWSRVGEPETPKDGTNIGDLVKAGGTDYKLLSENCIHASKDMMSKNK